MSTPFRFDAVAHEYTDAVTGEVLPHITGMLEAGGYIDDEWYTYDSKVRGTAVHHLTSQFDLGALDVDAADSRYRGYVAAYVDFRQVMGTRVVLEQIEEALVHAVYRYGGRPDRVLTLDGLYGVLDVKTGPFTRSHPVQTALQTILTAQESGLPAQSQGRWSLHLKKTGRWKLQPHRDAVDFTRAFDLIRRFANARAA